MIRSSMLYPSNIEEKLGFDKIKNAIREKCNGEFGRSQVDKLKFSSDFELIKGLLQQTDEYVKIIQSGEPYPRGAYYNISRHLVKASKIDAYLTEEEFHELKLTLTKAENLLRFLKKNHDRYTDLSLLTVGVYLNPQILHRINQVIDEKGAIRNTASNELITIRDKLQELEFRIRGKLERILKKFVKEGYSNDDVNITIRNGRLVIPVRAEFKRVVGGFIHDESASGQTAFIEPSSMVELNNDIRDLFHKEKREIFRILAALTDLIRPEVDNLRKCYEFAGIMDFIQAKALYTIELEGVLPVISKIPEIDWCRARHPLLFLSHKKSGKIIVPLDINLNQQQKILVISGPNAGGKSVCLQTVGLIQYMFQCGLMVPLTEKSKMGIFSSLFIDIGDEQSLENDLSTYSSHLLNMNHFLDLATKRTLFLIDEFGTGTEPQFGGAIAEAILEGLRRKKCYGVITTHYTNLKKYAEKTDGVVNGAMRFDLERMEPLFELQIGIPGSSFALEIARKIGLPEDIIRQAKRGIGTSHVNFERLLGELEQEKHDFKTRKKKLEEKEMETESLLNEYRSLKAFLEDHKNSILNEARQEANDLLASANREIEKTIRMIKEAEADKEKTRLVRKELEKFKEKIRNQGSLKPKRKIKPDHIPVLPGRIDNGDYVKIKAQKTVGQVLQVKGDYAEVAIGDLKSKLKLSRLEKISRKDYTEISGNRSVDKTRLLSVDLNEKMTSFKSTLDLRGKRVEEAVHILEQFLDEALLLGKHEIRVLHGKGDGILRQAIRTHLSSSEFIDQIHDEDVEKGGAGVSVVHLK